MLIKKAKIPFKSIVAIGFFPSFIKKIIYRLKGYKIGRNVSIGLGSVIIGKNVNIKDNVSIGLITIIRGEEITIERYAKIGSFTVIDSGKIRIGEDSRINEQVIIGGIRTPESSLDLGKRTIIMEYSYINTTKPVKIGDDSGIGGHCLLFTHGSWLNQLDGFPVTFAPITLGKNVWLPWRVFIMPGISIGDNVVVGANSLIGKSVGSDCLVAGSPAKVIKENYPAKLSDDQKISIFKNYLYEFQEFLAYNNLHVEMKEDNNVITLIVNKKSKTSRLYFYINDMETSEFSENSIIISNIKGSSPIQSSISYKHIMFLDLNNKSRRGKSAIGEEFVKFISRYGLRFERLD